MSACARLRHIALCCAGLAACPGDDVAPATTTAATPASGRGEDGSDPDFRARAHAAALARFVEAGQAALVLADPVTAFELGLAPLAPMPLSRSARGPVREAVNAALAEAEGIDRQELSAQDGMLRDTVSTALHGLRRDLDQRPALRRDPTLYVDATARLVEVVERGAVPAEQGDAALRSLGDELTRSVGLLGGTSAASLAAARLDLATLDSRLTALPGPPSRRAAIDEARAGVASVQARLTAVAAVLEAAKANPWSARVGGALDPEAVVRLPDRLGAAELSRRLSDEESWAGSPKDLAAEITVLLARLASMRDRLTATAPSAASGVSVSRCTAAWSPIEAWATANPALGTARLDCTADLGRLPSSASDATLALASFRVGVIEPSRETRRKAIPAALALSSGRMASAGQHHALAVSGLIAAKQTAAAAEAIAESRAALCGALAATLEHAELDTPAARTERLTRDCPESDPEALRADALARPRQAIAAAGMVLINRGPAEAAALSRFWWARLGLVMPLADPERAKAPDPATIPKPKLEPLDPADLEAAATSPGAAAPEADRP